MTKTSRILALFTAVLVALGIAVAIGAPAYAAPPQGVHLKILQYQSGKCLDVTGYSYNNGARLQLYDCFPGNDSTHWNQQFYLWAVDGTPFYRIYSAWSHLCLDITGFSMDPGAPLQQYECLSPDIDHRNQQFALVETGSYGYYIVAAHSG